MVRNLRLITETRYDFEVLEESTGKNEKDLYIVGIFSSAESKNANGRVYRKTTLEREVERLQEENFKTGVPLFGLLGHPAGTETDLSQVAVRTVALEWRGNDIYGKAKVIKGTPCGDIAATLLKESKLGISSRGLGEVDEDGYVNDSSYRLLTWDLVSQPSTNGAWVNGIYESKTFPIGKETDDELLEELDRQRNEYCKKLSVMFKQLRGTK